MPTVTVSRIMDVHATLSTTVNKTNEYSTLSPDDQDKRLAQSCAEVCALLTDWLVSEEWLGMCPSGDQLIDDFLQDQEHLDTLLPTLKDVLDLASRHGMTVPPEYVDQAREALRAAAKLFKDAEAKVVELRREVCKLAYQLRDLNATPEERANAREKADRFLEKIFTRWLPVLAVVIAIVSVNPSQVPSNAAQWIQVFNRVAVQVIADTPIQDISGMAGSHLSRQDGPQGEAPHIRPVHGPATIPHGAGGAQAVPARPQGEAPHIRPVHGPATIPHGAGGAQAVPARPQGEAPHIRPVHGPATIPHGAGGAQAVPARPQGESLRIQPVPPSATRPRGRWGVPPVVLRVIRRGPGTTASPAEPKAGKTRRSPKAPGGGL